ncbi:MAG: SMI1/KNR4 family protein, partial [Schleiferiaceae bacterium]|nr:SMI1/KNR4 family protein [Schleiferiaceae bacterium]
MTNTEIERFEKTIKKKLPQWYAHFLMSYPEDLVRLGAPYNTVSELSLPNNLDRLIELDKYDDLPNNILIIGEDGLGNFYYVLLDHMDTRIYLFDHEAPTFLDDRQLTIDYSRSYDLVFSDLDELIDHLKETLTAHESDLTEDDHQEFLHPSEVKVEIICEMHDEWQRNRNQEVADSYPYAINYLEVAKALKVKESLFKGYPNDYTITYTYLVTVEEQGRQIEASFEGGDN